MFHLNFVYFLFLNICVYGQEHFEVIHQWRFFNYTWPSASMYRSYVENGRYAPVNVSVSGIKIHNGRIFINMPRLYDGIPVTLGYISINDSMNDPLITPFPSWEMNTREDCNGLLNVQATEIDTNGVIWILDGIRINNFTQCPPKIVLIDTESREIIHTKVFPEEVSLSRGGWLDDIVIDESDGGWAYITDVSPIDPGLIVYSRATDRAWKLRDSSMFGDVHAPPVIIRESPEEAPPLHSLLPIDGIALSPSGHEERFVYYCAFFGYDFYSISTNILKNEELCRTFNWRRRVNYLGRRPSESDGMMMDNEGNLYITLYPLYAVGTWNINSPFQIEILEQNPETIIWPDSFGFDNNGSLYLLADNSQLFLNDNFTNRHILDVPLFRILRRYTGTRSYMYS